MFESKSFFSRLSKCLTCIYTYIYTTAQQSCVPATAPKRKVAKLHFVYPSNLYLYTIFGRIQLKVWRIENLRIEGPKSKSGGSKFEVQRVQNRGLDGFLAALRTARRSWDHPEGVVVRLGGGLEPWQGRFGCVLEEPGGRLWVVLGSSWKHMRLSEGVVALRMEAERSIPCCWSILNEFCFQKSMKNHWTLL